MSSYTISLDPRRVCRYAFTVRLWDSQLNSFGNPTKVLLDTGSYNTIVHKSLAVQHGVMLKATMTTSIGGYKGIANLCVLNKMNVGGCIIEKIVALAVPFEGELKDHILLGANVTNNWKFTLSRLENRLIIQEQLSENALQQSHPYRYCFNNSGKIMAFQEYAE